MMTNFFSRIVVIVLVISVFLTACAPAQSGPATAELPAGKA
jgi:hypothetical protein